jgi:hypothetical protein
MAKLKFYEVFNSISDSMSYFVKMSKFTLNLLTQLQDIFTSDSETVSINVQSDTGVEKSFVVPTMQSVNSKLEKQNRDIRGLRNSMNKNNFKPAEGLLIKAPARITELTSPNRFITKPNWFLENFLNPMIFVQFKLNNKVDFYSKDIQVQRVIIRPNTNKQIKFFNDTYKGKNNLDYNKVINELNSQEIPYQVDEKVENLPPSFIKNIGSFSVVGIKPNTPIVESEYFLNTLNYAQYDRGNYQEMFLKIGDVLYTGTNTTYRILSVDSATESIKVLQLEGEEAISMGVDTLSIASTPEKELYLDIGVSYDERQIIFIRPIDPFFNIMDTTWSDGVGFYSNDLVTETSTGTINFSDYYNNFVTDYGISLLGQVTDFKIPSIFALKPDAPVLSKNNFKVVKVNSHKLNTQNTQELAKISKDLARLSGKILSYNSELSILTAAYEKLSRTRFLGVPQTPQEIQRKLDEEAELAELRTNIDELITQRNIDTTLQNAVQEQLKTFGKSKDVNLDPKYQVQGFWPIPTAKFDNRTGFQEIVQFIIEYRYLSLNAQAINSAQASELSRQQQEFTSNATQINFIGNSGENRIGYFSPWNRITSPVRKKEFDELTGKFKWAVENVQDADENNINQLAIPVSRGEIVEIRIKSISEAGWPSNGSLSDWSSPVQVAFPDDILDETDTQVLLSNIESTQLTTIINSQLEVNSLRLIELNQLLDTSITRIAELELKVKQLTP